MDAKVIDELHKLAEQLFKKTTVISGHLELADKALDGKGATQFLKELCEILGSTGKLLRGTGSPLNELVRLADGCAYSDSLNRVAAFVQYHRQAISELGLDRKTVEKAVAPLRELETAKSPEKLQHPQGMAREDAKGILDSIKDFRDLVCGLSNAADLAKAEIKAVVDGALGVAYVIMDVTSLASLGPHPFTGLVLVHAIKSTWWGAKKIKGAINALRGAAERLGIGNKRRRFQDRARRRPRVILRRGR